MHPGCGWLLLHSLILKALLMVGLTEMDHRPTSKVETKLRRNVKKDEGDASRGNIVCLN